MEQEFKSFTQLNYHSENKVLLPQSMLTCYEIEEISIFKSVHPQARSKRETRQAAYRTEAKQPLKPDLPSALSQAPGQGRLRNSSKQSAQKKYEIQCSIMFQTTTSQARRSENLV